MKKQKFEDDGRSFTDMNVEGAPWYNPCRKKKGDADASNRLELTRKERRAMIGAAFRSFLPIFGIILAGFAAAIALVCIWLL